MPGRRKSQKSKSKSQRAQKMSEKECSRRSWLECETPHNACKAWDYRSVFGYQASPAEVRHTCTFVPALQQTLRKAKAQSCEPPGCLCTTSKRPYTHTYRGRTYCDSESQPLAVDLVRGVGAYTISFNALLPRIKYLPVQLMRKLKNEVSLRGPWRSILSAAKAAGYGTMAGVFQFMLSSFVRNACLASTYYYGPAARGVLNLPLLGPSFVNVSPLRQVGAKDYALPVSKSVQVGFEKMCREMKHIVLNMSSPGYMRIFRAYNGVVMGTVGAQEEIFFRGWISRFTERVKRPIYRFLKKLGLRDKAQDKYVERIFVAINAVISGVLFGLAHISNLGDGSGGFLYKQAVHCQVVFTAVLGVVLSYLKRYTTLVTAFVSHFMHNAIASFV